MRPKAKKLQWGEQRLRAVAIEVSSAEDMWGEEELEAVAA